MVSGSFPWPPMETRRGARAKREKTERLCSSSLSLSLLAPFCSGKRRVTTEYRQHRRHFRILPLFPFPGSAPDQYDITLYRRLHFVTLAIYIIYDPCCLILLLNASISIVCSCMACFLPSVCLIILLHHLLLCIVLCSFNLICFGPCYCQIINYCIALCDTLSVVSAK